MVVNNYKLTKRKERIMPTGYTAELIEKGMEFNDFVLTCARAFGACIELRDRKLAPAPRTIPSNGNYHEE
jgi:hypothetical protein